MIEIYNKLKILFPINIDRWENSNATVLREIIINNPEIEFFSFSNPASEEDRALDHDFWKLPHVHKIKLGHLIKCTFDVVHHASTTYRNYYICRFIKLKHGNKIKHVFTATIQPFEDDDNYKWYMKSLQKADYVTTVSYAVQKDVNKLGYHTHRVIHNGVDTNFFDVMSVHDNYSRLLKDDRPYVLFVGTITERKRPDVFISLAKRFPGVDFIMAGGYYYDSELHSYLKSIESSNVKYLGILDKRELRDIMFHSSLLVFPSELEGLPLTVLEALSLGVPVIASNKSSLPEIFIGDLRWFMLSNYSIRSWEAKVNEVLNWSRDKRDKFSQDVRKFIRSNYDWKVIAKLYRKFYREITS